MLLLSLLYRAAVRARVWAYSRGVLRARSLRGPVVSVGNLTTGGTGKTPLVAFLARTLKEAGFQPVILSRGYRGRAESSVGLVSDGHRILCRYEECGDEPYLLARKLPGVPIVVGRNRYRAGRMVERLNPRAVYVLDDGFQHLALRRDLNVVLLDGTDPFGGGKLLPAGRLREPPSALRRADLAVITRAHLPLDRRGIQDAVRRENPHLPVFYFGHRPVGLRDVRTEEEFGLDPFRGRRVLALAGVGNPRVLVRDLEAAGMEVAAEAFFRDHHPFSPSDLKGVWKRVEEVGAQAVITTEKDAVRLASLDLPAARLFAFLIEPSPEEPERFTMAVLERLGSTI